LRRAAGASTCALATQLSNSVERPLSGNLLTASRRPLLAELRRSTARRSMRFSRCVAIRVARSIDRELAEA